MKEFKDPAIREMLRRRHAAVPPLSDDFEEKLFVAYEQRKKERLALTSNTRASHSRRELILWPSIAAAATVALLLMLHFTRQTVSEVQMAQVPTAKQRVTALPVSPTIPSHVGSEKTESSTLSSRQRKKNTIRHTSKPSLFNLNQEKDEVPMLSESNPIVELEETAATEVATLTATAESETEPTPMSYSVNEAKPSSLKHHGDDMSRRVQKRFGRILALTTIAREQT